MEFFDDELNNVLNIFQQESSEIIQSINGCIGALSEDNQNDELFLNLSRLAHSLKGSARMMGFNNIQSLAHKMEDVIGCLKEKKIQPTNNVLNLLSQTVEYISFLINKTVENKQEYYTDELNTYISGLQSVIENNKELPKDENAENKTFIQIKALVTELVLYYLKYKNDGDLNCIHDFRIKLIELKNVLRANNFEDEITSLNNTLGVICRNEANFKNQVQFDGKLLEFLEAIKELFSKNNAEAIDFLETAKKQFDELNQPKKEEETVKNPEIKKIRSDINQEVLLLLKELNNDIDEIKSNPDYLNEFNTKLDKIIKETKFFEIKKLAKSVKRVMGVCVSKNIFPQNNIDILKQLITDSTDIAEDANASCHDFKLIEDRVNILEESFENDFIHSQKTYIEKKEKEPKAQTFKGNDWLNSIDNREIKTLRVDSSKLDKLANQVNELIMYRIKNTEHIALFRKLQNDFEEWSKSWHKIGYYLKYYEKRYLSGSNISLDIQSVIMHNKQLISLYEMHSEGCSKMLDLIYIISKQLQEEDSKLVSLSNELEAMSKTLRILPLATIFHLFPRMVQNIASDWNKQIDFVIEGSEVSADKKILEEIKMPLIHILRNSVDHGIETPEERIKKGKSPIGKIGIKAWVEGNKIFIDIKDDGRGLDIEKIRSVAVKKGLIKDNQKEYTTEDIIDFIFYPGFSTEENITELSGRGLGLDIVKEKVSELDGKINIFSKFNEGTCIRIELPIQMSTINVFVIRENKEYYAIDTSYINIVTRISSSDIYAQDGQSYFVHNKKIIPIFSLSQILGIEKSKHETEKNTVMILKYEGNNIAIAVDKLIGDQEIIQKKLFSPFLNVKSVSGVTTLANGETCLVLNIKDIFSYLSKKLLLNISTQGKLLEETRKAKCKILVTDDSLTTRALEQSILKSHGYNVTTACDGLEALEKLKNEHFDILITDYDMPKMSGIELTRVIRDKEKNDIPIIVLTSYEKSFLEEQFSLYNVKAYIQKNQFNQDVLINIINEIMLDNDTKNN